MLLDEEERNRVKGIIINKFRGNVESFKPAMRQLEEIIKIPVLGAMPYFALDIEDEDSVTERINNKSKRNTGLDIVVIRLPHMSNFTDFNSLSRLDNVSIRYVDRVKEIRNPHLLIIPGSKNTIDDIRFLKEKGLYDEIVELEKRGITILGICGGYQMMGSIIKDNLGIEGEKRIEKGFDFLPTTTKFNKEKITKQSSGKIVSNIIEEINNIEVYGYEIHNGETLINNDNNIFIKLNNGEVAGAINDKGNVIGTYLHGIFDNGDFIKAFIKSLIIKNNLEDNYNEISSYKEYKLKELDKLSKILDDNIDMEKVKEFLKI